MNEFPRIRLEIEGMKYQVLHALSTHNTEIEEEVQQQVEQAIKNFDFKAVIKAEIDKALPKMIEQAVQSSLQRVMWAEPIKKQFDIMVHRAVLKQLYWLKGEDQQEE